MLQARVRTLIGVSSCTSPQLPAGPVVVKPSSVGSVEPQSHGSPPLSSQSTSPTRASTRASMSAASPVVLHGGFASALANAWLNLLRHFAVLVGSIGSPEAACFDSRPSRHEPFLPDALSFALWHLFAPRVRTPSS